MNETSEMNCPTLPRTFPTPGTKSRTSVGSIAGSGAAMTGGREVETTETVAAPELGESSGSTPFVVKASDDPST